MTFLEIRWETTKRKVFEDFKIQVVEKRPQKHLLIKGEKEHLLIFLLSPYFGMDIDDIWEQYPEIILDNEIIEFIKFKNTFKKRFFGFYF